MARLILGSGAFDFAEVRMAFAPEHARRFHLWDRYGGREQEEGTWANWRPLDDADGLPIASLSGSGRHGGRRDRNPVSPRNDRPRLSRAPHPGGD